MSLIDLHFLLRSAQNCKKCTLLDNLRTITQEGNMGSWYVKYLNFWPEATDSDSSAYSFRN